ATDKSPVFNLFPLIDDGAPYTYTFDYESQNGWLSTSAPVKKERITKANLYIDFGVFGKVGTDSVWIENIWVEDGTSPLRINRPSHLAGSIASDALALTWEDNSSDENGFEIHRATNSDGPYT